MIYLIFLSNLFITVLAEGAVMALLFRKWQFVYYSVLGNVLTNPALNLFLFLAVRWIGVHHYYTLLIPLEIAAILIECYIYQALCRFTIKKALGLSLLANAISFGIGWILF